MSHPTQSVTAWKHALSSVKKYGIDSSSSLLELIAKAYLKADEYNEQRLAMAYPELAEAVNNPTYVYNEHGIKINYAVAVELMDDNVREYCNDLYAPCTPQYFFDRYCEHHFEVFDNEFELAKENPVF